MVKAVTTLDEFKTIINGDRPAVFDFWATWCGPCRLISPIFEKLSSQFTEVDFYKVDVDEAQDIAQELSVRAMPTFMAFKGGEKVKEVVGANPGAVQAMIQSVAPPAADATATTEEA